MFSDIHLSHMRPTQRTGKEKLERLFDPFAVLCLGGKNKPSERDRSPNKSRGPKGKKRKW